MIIIATPHDLNPASKDKQGCDVSRADLNISDRAINEATHVLCCDAEYVKTIRMQGHIVVETLHCTRILNFIFDVVLDQSREKVYLNKGD